MIIILSSLLFIIFVIVTLLFSSSHLSPIPYFPTNKKDLPLIIKAFKLKNNQTIIDLGAGDGMVIFEAAKAAFEKKLNTQFVAVDINPVLILIMHLRRLFHPNRKNIKIIRSDLFKNEFINFINFKNSVIIYLYVSPWFLEKIIKEIINWKLEIGNLSIISYMYPIKSLKNRQKMIKGRKHDIFVYNLFF